MTSDVDDHEERYQQAVRKIDEKLHLVAGDLGITDAEEVETFVRLLRTRMGLDAGTGGVLLPEELPMGKRT